MKALVRLVILISIIEAYAAVVAAQPLSLQDCILQAIHHSPSLSAARHQAAALREGVIKQRSALMPFLSAQATAYEVNGNPTTPFSALRVFDAENPVATKAHWGPVGLESIGVQYPLIQNGSILGLNDPPEVAAARAALNEKLAGLLLTEQKVVFDTVTAYSYSVWYSREVALASKVVRLSEQRFEIVKYQAQLELKLPQDVDLARAQVEAAQDIAASARQNAQDSIASLSALIGRPDSDITIDTNPLPTPQLPPLRDFLAHVMPVHPALRVQQGQIEVARQQVRIDKAALWPSIKLNFGLAGAQNLEHFQGNTLSNFLSFIQVDIPIFDFGKRKAAVRASQQELAAEQDSLKAIDLALRTSISQTYHQMFDYDERIAAVRIDVLKASNAAALAQAERNEELIDELTLVQAQLQVPALEMLLGQEQLLMQLKYAELRNLSGGIWDWLDDLTPSSAPFASGKHYNSVAKMAKHNKTTSVDARSGSGQPVVEPTHTGGNDRARQLKPIAGPIAQTIALQPDH